MDWKSGGRQRHADWWRWPGDRLGIARNLCDKFDEKDKGREKEENEPENA